MSSGVLPRKVTTGFYPERTVSGESQLDRLVLDTFGNLTHRCKGRFSRFDHVVKRVLAHGKAFQGLSEEELRVEVNRLRLELCARDLDLDQAVRAFALVREFSDRKLGMRHFDVQIMGGWALLNGMVAEMVTGEGKTLTATLPACTAALAGIPVHIITVNDYLAKRDAEGMGPVYEAMGLSVGVVTQGMSLDERRKAYRCDVTYCTNKEIVFDYLKDRLLFRQWPGHIQMHLENLCGSVRRSDKLCLRGLCFAIVDEADSVLIDEARTPLIISGPGNNAYEAEVYQQALGLADQLRSGRDFSVDRMNKNLYLTEPGKEELERLTEDLGGFWGGRRFREELVRRALTAQHLYHKDKDYLIRNGKVQIVDEYTGRIMADRSWEQGLHQLIEAKEGCEISTQNETLARISYQRFFRRYIFLAGMTGTAREVAKELWAVYRLNVVSIPTHRPLIRRALPARVYRTEQAKWSVVVKKISDLHEHGRPVLVGTRSVAASEHLSSILSQVGLPHRVLNARQDKEEADIIAQGGQKGQITIATNMAGRGTDIALTPEVKKLGGLHVIATERHEARRIDRQLFGRCGRQGDEGSFEAITSLEDELLKTSLNKPLARIGRLWVSPGSVFGRWLGNLLATYAQKSAERRHLMIRRDLLKHDEFLSNALAFSGRGE